MAINQETRAYNDRNVYILGAGFSYEAGLPLIKDFMNHMRDAAAWLEEQGNRKDEVAAIESVLAFRLKAAAAAYRTPLNVENIEELFSLASASGSTELSDEVTLAIAATLDFCSATAPACERVSVTKVDGPKWVKFQPRNWKLSTHDEQRADGTPGLSVYSCPVYEFFLGLLCGYFNETGADRRDTVISLNYDTVVEDALSALGLPFCYAGEEMIDWRSPRPATDLEQRLVPVLKLHGSLNLGVRISEAAAPKLWGYASYHELMSEGRRPMLVAPTWQKSVSGYLSAVWREAVSALKTATRIVILGYSVSQTDQHFKYLLAAGLQDNISLRKVIIVNPDDSDQFKNRLSSLFRNEHFEHGTVLSLHRTVKWFLMGEDCRQLIGRTFKEGAWRLAT